MTILSSEALSGPLYRSRQWQLGRPAVPAEPNATNGVRAAKSLANDAETPRVS